MNNHGRDYVQLRGPEWLYPGWRHPEVVDDEVSLIVALDLRRHRATNRAPVATCATKSGHRRQSEASADTMATSRK